MLLGATLTRARWVWRLLFGAAVLAAVAPPTTHAGSPDGPADGPWTIHIRHLDRALAERNVSAAARAWHDAYLEALGSRQRWDGMVEVGDAYLRVGEAAKGRKAAEPTARRLYLAALYRARRLGSVHGVLRTAEAFGALGDREVVEQCLHIAGQLAVQTRDPQARERVEAFRGRLPRDWTTPLPSESDRPRRASRRLRSGGRGGPRMD